MIHSILIANRGEIASRIIRTCRKMGIRSIAIFSEADRTALFVEQADISAFIGKSDPATSYLNQEKIIETAKKTGADAIHPGYGFLSENADFARKCAAASIIFIGPNPAAMEAMGSKSNAKKLMQAQRVPVVPGYQGMDQSLETLTKAAIEIGFPILLKATAGGGGKGMRIVHSVTQIEAAIQAAKRESKNAFGDEELIIEKYIEAGRHIEFQIFGDQHGNVIHLLERECSIQRRYQKIIEESPSPILTKSLRTKMGAAAIKAAKALSYDNAGTVEFIFDEKTQDFYFLEINTRLQVEHPVTEEITGLDLVEMQIESAQGLPLSLTQTDVKSKGYALECRLYAEDTTNHFLPVTGTIQRFEVPKVAGLRIETAIRSGSEISAFYDPMIAKIIVWGLNRAVAHRKMKYALNHLICLGTTTNQAFLLQILKHPDFQKGQYDTHFITKLGSTNLPSTVLHTAHFCIAATLFAWQKRENARTLLKSTPSGWRNSFYDFQKETYLIKEEECLVRYRFQNGGFQFLIDEQNYSVLLISCEDQSIRLEIEHLQYSFNIAQDSKPLNELDNDTSTANFYLHNEQFGTLSLKRKARFPRKKRAKAKGGYEAPMPSQIIKILVKKGQKVTAGEELIVLSSMKMENTIEAIEDGTVEEIFTTVGANVGAGFLLLKII